MASTARCSMGAAEMALNSEMALFSLLSAAFEPDLPSESEVSGTEAGAAVSRALADVAPGSGALGWA